jgi:hypothetical protein
MGDAMKFRIWLNQRWYAHCFEIEEWTGRMPPYPMSEVFAKYKYWLIRESRYQQGEKNGS